MLRRGDSYTAEVHVPEPDAGGSSPRRRSGAYERQDGERVDHGAVQAGRGRADQPQGAASILANTKPGPITRGRGALHGLGRLGQDYAAYPAARRSEFDVDKVMKRSQYERTWELSKRLKRGAEYPMDYVRAVDDYLHGPSSATSSAPRSRPRARRRWTTSSTRPTRATASTTRARWRCCCGWAASPRAWRPASARAATRRARRPGSCATPTRTRGSRSGSTSTAGSRSTRRPDATPARSQVAALAPAPGAAPPAAAADTGAADAAANTERPNLTVRPELQLGTRRRPDRRRRPTSGGISFWVWALGVLGVAALVLAVLLFLRRPRGKTPMDRAITEVENALRRVGRPVTTGTTMTQLERRLGSHSPEVSAYLRALAAGRYAPLAADRRRAPAAARCAARSPRASASAPACARCGRCRRGSNARRANGRARSRSRPACARRAAARAARRAGGDRELGGGGGARSCASASELAGGVEAAHGRPAA